MATPNNGFTVPRGAGTIATQTFQGLSGGMNLSNPPHELPDSQARYLQDVLLDNAGIIRLRGPLTKVSGVPDIASTQAAGITSMIASDGVLGIALLSWTTAGSAVLQVLNSTLTSWVTLDTGTYGNGTANTLVVDMHPAASGETFISWCPDYKAATPAQVLWGGAHKPNWSTGTATVTQGSKAVTGGGSPAWNSNVEVGMYLFDGTGNYVGKIASVNSNTSLTLVAGAIVGISAASYSIRSYRRIVPNVAKGRITCDSTGATTPTTLVTGGDTNFTMMNSASQLWDGSNSITWSLFRLPDLAFIGTVSSVTNDTSLSLTTTPAVSMANDRWVAIPTSGILLNGMTSLGFVGFLTATYQSRQFYANNPAGQMAPTGTAQVARIWFSEPSYPDQIDMRDVDGDFFDVHSTAGGIAPITALAGLQNALAIFKENELWALYGNDPTNFVLKKIADVGTWSNGSVQVYQNMVVFASRTGIMAFDGVNVTPLSPELGSYWQDGVKTSTKQMRSMIHRDHYFITVPDFVSSYTRYKGGTGTTPSTITFVLNMVTGAIVAWTNFRIGGSARTPPSFGKTTWFIGNTSTPTVSTFDADLLFNTTGTDAVVLAGDSTAGPDLYIETKKYDGKDAERKKLWKQMMMDYYVKGDTISMDTITGLTTAAGVTTSIPWPIQLDFTNARIKFLKRSTHIGFRLYETNGNVTDAQIGPWGIGFKYQRPGRV